MQQRQNRLGRPLAIVAATALGLGGLFAAPAAFATVPSTASTPAPVSGSAYQEQAAALLADPSVQAVGRDADNNVVVVKIAGSQDSGELKAFDATFDNVIVKTVGGPLTDYSADDVVGGAGYFSPSGPTTGAACSIGFSAWTPKGKPAVLSAGHCTSDGALTDTYLTLPTTDPAGGGAGNSVDIVAELGTFGFSQFGGPGNSKGTNNTDSIDVSVIDLTNDDLTTLPEVTDWTTAESEDLSKSTVTITSVGSAVAGEPVAKSGRTTGYTDGVDVDLVDGWANIGGRLVYGFASSLVAAEGDSGGAVFQGGKAVGILSGGRPAEAGAPAFLWASDLPNDLAHLDGYTVKVAVKAPKLTGPTDGGSVQSGDAISGTAPVSSTVTITPKDGESFGVDVDAAGAWSFPAPVDLGSYAFTAQAKIGFNASPKASFSVKVVPVPLATPVITSPADGAKVVTALTKVSGTGTPGATVTVTGDVQGTDTVDASGAWSVPADLSYGTVFSIEVTQSADGQTSPIASSVFSVVPTPAVITSPVDGSTIANADKPTNATGTGITGAEITATINGQSAAGFTTVVDGQWSLVLGAGVQVGTNELVVNQTIDQATTATTITFTVQAAAGTPTSTPTPTSTSGGGAGSGGGSGSGNGGGLANTGLDVAGFGVLAAILLALGSAFLVTRRRTSENNA